MAEAVANTNVLKLLKKNARLELPENILFQDVAFIAHTYCAQCGSTIEESSRAQCDCLWARPSGIVSNIIARKNWNLWGRNRSY